MKAEIIGTEDGIIGVKVIDPRGNQHLVEIDVEDEDSEDLHAQESYPLDASKRTQEQERLMNQVAARARFEAHTQTEYEILRDGWDPRQLRRGIDALENMPAEEFDEAFREYYHALINPEKTKEEYGITKDSVEFPGEPQVSLIMKGFCIDESNKVVNVLSDFCIYYSNENAEMNYTTGTFASCSDNLTQITPMIPPFKEPPGDDDFVYPEDFRGFMIHNLICQIRDIYLNMGEDPPEQYNIQGFGKGTGNFDYDQYLPWE
ncbi:uncharacterized protein Nmag_1188 [Natrialba magadii ATCC 43099]|uniref:Uncharacterized protein n=1 Tax=Natrialba magadii (strain ATCC 43099 / DSM 3394 / CCM 3739 / CIP 104546 / IAM 13178 / JCM 8861 / NBRC 102185 / NCIMB 2190 / MS3) TaxID=547559 RepID=D3SS45_NATMM|nr:hypothetical protein [Natrialba magadii]ADD04771.1 uncharacterized protein Nmag_1188 [Natrialba magadii ATCC 43099]ELY24938.1 hypothetical protein C500_18458 [Natrialba magadii ATCC 43099]